MRYALIPVIDSLVEFMEDTAAECSKEEFFEQGDHEMDQHMYDFVWSIYQLQRGVKQ